MILLDKLTSLSAGYAEILEGVTPLKIHPDVLSLASHLSTDPDKLEAAAAHIFWPSFNSWIEWVSPEGWCGFYFNGQGTDSVTEGWGFVTWWRHGEDEPLTLSLRYEMQDFRVTPLNTREYAGKLSSKLSGDALRMYNQTVTDMESKTFEEGRITREVADQIKPIVYAILALINSPKLVRRVHVDQTRINRSRLKRGRYPFHPHHEVKLDVDKTTVKALTGSKGDGSHKAHHFVRAHLRFRLGQYELVKPHWRGDPEVGVIETDYAAGRSKSKWRG